jgi:hypothetical protein
LDFLGSSLFGKENLGLWLLDFLGFSWNLSSESRLINGLRGKISKIIFGGLAHLTFASPERAPPVKAMRMAGLFIRPSIA